MADPTYSETVSGLAEELRQLAALPPEQGVLALVELLDRKSATSLERRLSEARQLAAREVVAAAGNQVKAAKVIGISPQLMSRIVRGVHAR